MKKLTLLILSASVLSMAPVYAATPAAFVTASDQQVCHQNRCNGVQVNTLDINGHGDIRHSSIKNEALVRGHVVIDDSSFGSLNVQGHAEIDKTHIAGNTMLHGHADIEDSQLHQLTVYGHIMADDSEFIGSVTVYGDAHFEDSRLAQPLTVHGQHLVLDNSKTRNITLHSNDSAPVCIVIKGNSVVNGDINVTGANPSQTYLIKYRQAVINGKVIGATTVSKVPKGC